MLQISKKIKQRNHIIKKKNEKLNYKERKRKRVGMLRRLEVGDMER